MTITRLNIPKKAFNLGEDLVIGEVRACYGSARAGSYAGSTTLAQCRYDLSDLAVFMEYYGVVGAHGIADPASRADFFDDARPYRLDHNCTDVNEACDTRGGSRTLYN